MNFYFVFQNKTFSKEKEGGFLWAPQGQFSHWRNMCNVKKDDIIFHSFNKKICAVSIAITDCYEAKQPIELKTEKLWGDDGWKIECQYFMMRYPIITSDYMDVLLQLQPNKYAPFNRIGRGNTGYLFDSNELMAKFILEKLVIKNANELQMITSLMK